MSCKHAKFLTTWAALLGLFVFSGCSDQQNDGANTGSEASQKPAETPPSVQPPAANSKTEKVTGASKPSAGTPVAGPAASPEGRDKESRPVDRSKGFRPIGELIADAKQTKEGAIDALAAAGPKAIPAIIAELRRDDRRYSWATTAMAKMGPEAVEPVVALLKDSDYFMRKIAYMTLGQMGPMAMPALPALQLAEMQDRDPRNRGLAASAISQIKRR
jgi:HEAT repeats